MKKRSAYASLVKSSWGVKVLKGRDWARFFNCRRVMGLMRFVPRTSPTVASGLTWVWTKPSRVSVRRVSSLVARCQHSKVTWDDTQ